MLRYRCMYLVYIYFTYIFPSGKFGDFQPERPACWRLTPSSTLCILKTCLCNLYVYIFIYICIIGATRNYQRTNMHSPPNVPWLFHSGVLLSLGPFYPPKKSSHYPTSIEQHRLFCLICFYLPPRSDFFHHMKHFKLEPYPRLLLI